MQFIADLSALSNLSGVGPIGFLANHLTFYFHQSLPEGLNCMLSPINNDTEWGLTALYANELPAGVAFWDSAFEVAGDINAVISALKNYEKSLPYCFESPAMQ
jgi:hypothetical protein